jgi:nicotinic acid mononucleotide adenylyltransferase
MFLSQLKMTVWILPVYQHIFAGKRSLESYEHRLAMCQLCFCPLSSETCIVKVLPLEREAYDLAAAADRESSSDRKASEPSPVRLGTVDIIEYIQSSSFNRENLSKGDCMVDSTERYSDIHLVLGTDTFCDLMTGRWKRAERYS